MYTQRRRIQIRLAQRAYRQRKDSTITELTERVVELAQSIDEMNQSFLTFRNGAAQSAFPNHTDLMHGLDTLAIQFKALAPGTAIDPKSDLAEKTHSMPARSSINGSFQDRTVTTETSHIDTSTYSTTLQAPLGYTFSTEPTDVEQERLGTIDKGVSIGNLPPPSFNLDQGLSQSNDRHVADFYSTMNGAHSLIPLAQDSMAAPSTYSFKEMTFARRLSRATHERACHILCNPEINADTIRETFKLTFCFSSLARVKAWARKMASTSATDSLERWMAPQLHLGDAGLHYPRTSLDGANPPPAFWANKAPMGPQLLTSAETPVPDWMTVEQVVEMIGFDGEWADASDVEHYLRSKGLSLDEHSSWAELDADPVPALEIAAESLATAPAVLPGHGTSELIPQHANSLSSNDVNPQGNGYLEAVPVATVPRVLNIGEETQAPWRTADDNGFITSTPLFNDNFFSQFASKKAVDLERFINSKRSSLVNLPASF